MNVASPPDYFDSQYRDYERQNPARKLDHYLDVLDLRLSDGEIDLLDLGCGLGAFLERTRRRHPEWNLSGIDMEKRAVDVTRARVPSASVEQGSADGRSHPAGTIDVITAWDVIEHIHSLEEVARSVSRMLKPHGLFMFVVPVYDGPLGPIVRILDRDPTHVHKQSRGFWLDWASIRFDVVDWHGIFRYLVMGRWHAHYPSRPLRNEAPAILVVCRRRADQDG